MILRGFTLLEVVITLGIFVVMFIALVSFFVSSNSTFLYDRSYVDTASGAEAVMTALSQAALQADAVSSSHTFSTGTFTTGTSTLVLELPAVDSAGTVIASTYDYIVFYTSGDSVYERTEAAAGSARRTATKFLTANASALTFTYDSSDMSAVTKVTADIETEATAKGSTLTSHLSQQFRLRNVL